MEAWEEEEDGVDVPVAGLRHVSESILLSTFTFLPMKSHFCEL